MRRAVQTTWQSTREVIEGANYEEADWKDQVGLATLSRAHPKHWGGGLDISNKETFLNH